MSISGNAVSVRIKAWDTANNVWKTGLTLSHFAGGYVTADGVDSAVSFTTSGGSQNIWELDDGGYRVALTGGQNTGTMMSFDCTVSDTGIIIVPVNWNNLPATPYSGTPPTAAAIATAIFQDLTSSGDFTVSGSIGKLLAAIVNA